MTHPLHVVVGEYLSGLRSEVERWLMIAVDTPVGECLHEAG